jgi:hypothetical protein
MSGFRCRRIGSRYRPTLRPHDWQKTVYDAVLWLAAELRQRDPNVALALLRLRNRDGGRDSPQAATGVASEAVTGATGEWGLAIEAPRIKSCVTSRSVRIASSRIAIKRSRRCPEHLRGRLAKGGAVADQNLLQGRPRRPPPFPQPADRDRIQT